MTQDLRDTDIVQENGNVIDKRDPMTIFRFSGSALVIVMLATSVAACSGPREATDGEDADELPTPTVRMSDYEDFDPSEYREVAVRPGVEVEHDVPESLMEGRADEGIRDQVRGYRVQVYSSLNKDEAVQREETAKSLTEMPVYMVYMQPYYRVRVGNFTSREAAERARSALAQQFPDAFIVPDTVEITR